MRALVLGASGYVGGHLLSHLGPERAIGTGKQRSAGGLVAFDAVGQSLSDLLRSLPGSFSHVFIFYGVVNPDQCARDPDGTAVTNVTSVQRVIEEAQAAGIVPVYISTDYVYDGTRGDRIEDEPQSAITEYGRQKARVERWLAERPGPWMVARLSKVVGHERDTHSVLGQWVNDIKAGKPMRSATDQIFSPAWVGDIVRALGDLAGSGTQGIVHVAGKAMSRYDLNRILADAVRTVDPAVDCNVDTCLLSEIAFAEPRPLNTSLSVARMESILPWRFRSMEDLSAEIARRHFAKN